MNLTTYYWGDKIIYRLEWEGGSIESSNLKLMAKTLVRNFRAELSKPGNA